MPTGPISRLRSPAAAGLHPRQVVHALGDVALRATGGDLRDDATVVCLDWYGGSPRPRTSNGGATTGIGVPNA